MNRSTRGGIVARREAHIEGRARKAVPFFQGAPGHRAGGGGSAMPALFQRDRFAAAGDLERELERIFVGLGAAVDPEHGVESQAREFRQPRGGALADRHGQCIGLKRHLPRLALERRQPARVAVAQSRDRMAAVEIQNLAAVARVQPHALAVRHLDRVLREHLRQMALERARAVSVSVLMGVSSSRSSRVPGP